MWDVGWRDREREVAGGIDKLLRSGSYSQLCRGVLGRGDPQAG